MNAAQKMIDTTILIVRMLAKKDYLGIESLSVGTRLSAYDISSCVKEYGRTVILSPQESYEKLDAIQIEGQVPASWSVRYHLWTQEEGKSDLSIVLTLTDTGDDLMQVEFDDILVL